MKFTKPSFGKRTGLLLFCTALAVSVHAQQRKITGTILDENGEPVIGASIKIQDTQSGAISDLDGKFSLNVPEGKKITITYIGYISQTLKPEGNVLQIVLQEDAHQLDEVVKIGYGTQKLKNVTGSVATISAKELEDLPVTNLAEALQGQINGLSVDLGSSRPGTNANDVYIRQNRTFTGISKDGGNSTPLIIIDDVIQLGTNGQPSMEQFNMLDPSEVESITVLRDASAAIYGSRAANGAILVTTKRGKSGVPRISYSGKFALNDAVGHSKVLRGSDYGRWANAFAIGSGKASNYDDLDNLYSDVEIAEMDNLHYDWLEKADWKAAFQQTHTLNVSGGNDRATYYAGATYLDQGANLGSQDYQRYTYRAGVDIKLTNDIKLAATIAGNEGKTNQIYTKGARFNAYGGASLSSKSDYNVLHHIPDIMPWSISLTDEDGNTEEHWLSPIANIFNNPRFDRKSISSWNYFSMIDSGSYSTNKSNSWSADISLTYEVPFVKGLTLRATYSASHSNDVSEQASFPYKLAYLSTRQGDGRHLVYTMPETAFTPTTFTQESQLAFADNEAQSRQMNVYLRMRRSRTECRLHAVHRIFIVLLRITAVPRHIRGTHERIFVQRGKRLHHRRPVRTDHAVTPAHHSRPQTLLRIARTNPCHQSARLYLPDNVARCVFSEQNHLRLRPARFARQRIACPLARNVFIRCIVDPPHQGVLRTHPRQKICRGRQNKKILCLALLQKRNKSVRRGLRLHTRGGNRFAALLIHRFDRTIRFVRKGNVPPLADRKNKHVRRLQRLL